jgi:hypothetical protein
MNAPALHVGATGVEGPEARTRSPRSRRDDVAGHRPGVAVSGGAGPNQCDPSGGPAEYRG